MKIQFHSHISNKKQLLQIWLEGTIDGIRIQPEKKVRPDNVNAKKDQQEFL
jgi:hypothetical protein